MINLLFIFALVISTTVNANECIGHIFFYNLDEGKGESDADSDYAFYYHKAKTWLPKESLSFSVHTDLPIKNRTCFSSEVTIPKEQLKYSLGYVFIKPNLEKKIIGGVMTDVDISSAINEFFK